MLMSGPLRVLIADAFETSGVAALEALGCAVTVSPKLAGDTLVAAMTELQPDVLVVRSTKVTEPVVTAGGAALRLVIRAGAGYDNIDVAAASRRGIYVATCPGQNAVAVAELAFGLIAALDRRIPDNVASLRSGAWEKGEFSKARGLYGRTLGVVGLGSIATELVRRAQAFGMRVVAWSRSLTDAAAAELGVIRLGSPEEVAAAADVVSVHLALNEQTRGFIGRAFFDAMRPGASFVNTSRSEIVDAAALRDAVVAKQLRVALDVWPDEPAASAGEFSSELAGLPGVIGTAHIGASTEQAQQAIAAEAVRIVGEFAAGREVPNVVNMTRERATPAACRLTVRHANATGVLAALLGAIDAAGLEVHEMANNVFDGDEAAIVRIELHQLPAEDLVDQIRRLPHVFSVIVRTL
jgi:D-3-phosphoglycerate dehydrogenase